MHLYIAAIYTAGLHHNSQPMLRTGEAGLRLRNRVRNILESYHYIHAQRQVDLIRKSGEKVFLDSGAFSAFSLGAEIDIEAYCDYVVTNADIIRKEGDVVLASVLDSIGSASGTKENQRIMESNGAKPLPCFHFNEPEEYLVDYIDNYEYITIGGMVPISTKNLIVWLDRIWGKYLTNPDGSARIKVHAFGVTSIDLMQRYPWFSVDSSSYIQASRTGSIYLPNTFKALAVSKDSPSRKMKGQHLDTLAEQMQEILIREIEASSGVSVEDMQTYHGFRSVHNMEMFRQLNDHITAKSQHFSNRQQELF